MNKLDQIFKEMTGGALGMEPPKWAPWQENVSQEHTELTEKIRKLDDFLTKIMRHEEGMPTLLQEDINLMLEQQRAMQDYYRALTRRLMRFPRV